MRCHYFKHIFPAAESKRQTPCCARAGDAGAAPPFLWGSQHRFHAKMRRPSPTLSITRVCFSSPPPFPPLGTLTAAQPSTPALWLPGGLPHTLLSGATCPRGCHRPCSASTGAVALPWSLSRCPAATSTPRRDPEAFGVPPRRLPPPSRPHPARPGASAIGATAGPQRAAAGRTPGQGKPRAGSDRSGADDRAQSPRRAYFVFALNSLCPGRQPPRGGRRGPSPPGFSLRQQERVAGIASRLWDSPQPGRGAPVGPGRAGPGPSWSRCPAPSVGTTGAPGLRGSQRRAPLPEEPWRQRCQRREPAILVHHRAAGAALGAPALVPKRRRSPGRGPRCRAVASPRPAASFGQRGVPVLGGGAGAQHGLPERQAGAPSGHPRRKGSSGARLWKTGARRGATLPRQDSAPGAPAPQPPGRGRGNRSPPADGASPRRSRLPADGEAAAVPVPTQAGPPPLRWQQILLRGGGVPAQPGRALPRGGDGASTAANVADTGGKDVCAAAASRAPEKREILFCSSTFPEIRVPRRPPPLQVLHYRGQVSAGILIKLAQSSHCRSKLGSLFRNSTPALKTA